VILFIFDVIADHLWPAALSCTTSEGLTVHLKVSVSCFYCGRDPQSNAHFHSSRPKVFDFDMLAPAIRSGNRYI
jgi:hypothetical protein